MVALGRRLGPLVLLLRVAVLVGRDLRVLARLVAPDGRLDLRRGGALPARLLGLYALPAGRFQASAAPFSVITENYRELMSLPRRRLPCADSSHLGQNRFGMWLWVYGIDIDIYMFRR